MIIIKNPLASNSPADPKDVIKIKKSLLRLGYYEPKKGLGILEYPDRNLFSGIKKFQKQNGLRPTGEIYPFDSTIRKLSQIESEELPPPNIPGTNIPDRGAPEGGTWDGFDPDYDIPEGGEEI